MVKPSKLLQDMRGVYAGTAEGRGAGLESLRRLLAEQPEEFMAKLSKLEEHLSELKIEEVKVRAAGKLRLRMQSKELAAEKAKAEQEENAAAGIIDESEDTGTARCLDMATKILQEMKHGRVSWHDSASGEG